MSPTDESPRDDRELNLGLEVHTPQWIPGVKAVATFRRVWEKRSDVFIETVSDAAGITRSELESRTLNADQFSDLIGIAARRVTERGDAEYRDALAGLVAAALIDEARIDTIMYVIDRITKLEPVHVRLLVLIDKADRYDQSVKESRDTGLRDREIIKWEERGPVLDGTIRISNLAANAKIDLGVVESCLSELATQSLVVRTGGEFQPGDATRAAKTTPLVWRLTRLGRTAADEIEKVRKMLEQARAGS